MAKILSSILLGILVVSCGSRDDWVEGALYATPTEDRDGYQVLKILKIDDHGFHIRLYSNRFVDLPSAVDEDALYMARIDREPGEELGMGHLPLSKSSFAQWDAIFIQQSSVSPDELEGYNMWLEAEGGYF